MKTEDYAVLDGVALAELIARREVSTKEVLAAAGDAISRVDPILNFAIEVYQDRIDTPAANLPSGPLAGVPTLLKDFLKYELGKTSECGVLLFEGNVGTYDSEIVLRLRAGGMPIIGRSSVPEFGWSSSCDSKINGITRNPWNLDTWPGGSSSGAAAAVASGALAIGHASDGGGSTRGPAAYQGLVGLKPTRGRVSDGPGASDPNGGMSAHLAVTRTVRDTAAVLDVLSGPAIGDPHLAPVPERPFLQEIGRPARKMKIALVMDTFDGSQVDPAIIEGTRKAARLLESMGHQVEEARYPVSGESLVTSTHTVWAAGFTASIDGLAQQLGRTPSPENLSRTIWATYLEGRQITGADYVNALGEMNQMRRAMGAFHQDWDMVLSPAETLLAQPHKVHDQEAEFEALAWTRHAFSPSLFLALANITGNPAITLPLYQTEAGAQFGTHLSGRFAEDAQLLRLAAELEQAQPWAGRRPPVHVCNDLSGFDRARKGRP